jgi:hypothetical protein
MFDPELSIFAAKTNILHIKEANFILNIFSKISVLNDTLFLFDLFYGF